MRSALVLLLLPSLALAQDVGFDAHDLTLSANDGDVRDPLLVHRPDVLSRGSSWFAASYEYAHEPLVSYPAGGDPRDIVGSTHGLHLNMGAVVHERVRVDVAAPLFFNAMNERGSGTHAALGDIRLTGLVELLVPEAEDDGLGLGVVARLSLPSGEDRAGLGDPSVRFEPSLAMSWASGPLSVAANAGFDLRQSIEERGGLTNPSRFTAGAAVGMAVAEQTGVTLEGRLAAPLKGQQQPGQATPAELLLSARQQFGESLHALVGAAAGVGPGVGAAEYRLLAGVGWTFGRDADVDRDADGLRDRDDTCPREPETANGYRDEDGCPDELATVDLQVLDADGIVEGAQGWVTVGEQTYDAPLADAMPGERATVIAELGCAVGESTAELHEGANTVPVTLAAERAYTATIEVVARGGGPVEVVSGRWREPGYGCVVSEDVAFRDGSTTVPVGERPLELRINAEGYRPARLSVFDQPDWEQAARTYRVVLRPLRDGFSERQIDLPDRILFEVDTANLHPSSKLILDAIAQQIAQLPPDERVEVEGHTDSTASDSYNQALSERRAAAVVEYLVSKGVRASRLTPRGYGEAEPIATNATEAGREQNRRVVFTVLKPTE